MRKDTGRVVVTTTTFYADPTGKDKVRFDLACELVQEAILNDHVVVVVDGSPTMEVGTRLHNLGAHVFPQTEKGIGPSRRQVWREAENFISADTSGIFWTEPEKSDIIRLIPVMLACMREKDAWAVIPRRTERSWGTYPGFQRESEQIANAVYNNLFSGGPWDPMFGPVLFHPEMLSWFVGFVPAEGELPDTYVQHYVPVRLRHFDFKVVSVDVNFIYPSDQRVEEESAKSEEMLKNRLWQLRQLVEAYFAISRNPV